MSTKTDSRWQRILDWVGDHPLKSLCIYMAASVVIWTVQCTLLQKVLPLDVLETINWGAQWSWGHYKHPPLSGWLGYIFSILSGHHDWSMYLLAQLCLVVGVFFTYKLAREFFDETGAAASALLLYMVAYYTPSPMKYCSHFVQSAVQPVMAWLFYVALRDNKWHQWTLFGAITALAILGKYSAGMLLVALFVLMLCSQTGRSRFLYYGPYLALFVCLLLLAPHLIWLAQNDFCCIRHLDHRVEASNPSPWFAFAVLAVSLHPLAIEAAALILARFKNPFRWRTETGLRPVHKQAVLWSALLYLIPCGMLVLIAAFGKSVILMWFSSMVSWSGMLLVALLPIIIDKRVYRNLFVIVCLYTMIVFVATTVELMVKPKEKLHTAPQDLVKLADDFWKENYPGEPIPCLIGYRWLANAVENYSPHRPPSADWEDPVSIQRIGKIIDDRGVLLIGENEATYSEFLKENYPGIVPAKTIRKLTYHTLFGPTCEDNVFMMALPPRKQTTE